MTGYQRNSRAARIRALLAAAPSGATALELSALLIKEGIKVSRQQATSTLRQLHDAGLVRQVRVGRGVTWFAGDRILAMIAPPTPFSLPPKQITPNGSKPVTGHQRQSQALHDATVAARQPLREQLQADLAKFLSQPGNRIEIVPRGATGESLRLEAKHAAKGPRPFVINPAKRGSFVPA